MIETVVEHRSFRGYSRESQKLIYWLISDYSNSLTDNEVGTTPRPYNMWVAKENLKKFYLKSLGLSKRNIYPFKDFIKELDKKFEDVLSKNISNESKKKIMLNDVEFMIIKEYQMLSIKLGESFSLALNSMTQEEANNFITWLFDFFLDKNIPMREEIAQLYAEQQNDKYIYSLLKNKKCAICGKQADLHHWDSVASIGGYDKDNGLKTRFMPLCREHHTEFHTIGIKEFQKKYLLTGIYLTKECIPILKKVYPNHFRAFKEEL